jgi:D-alanyl-lipoteichoic acid acyltransferase DltB (MBOAT superfamily)
MLFYTPEFLVFSIILLGTLGIVHRDTPRKVVLLVASYIFYMWWNPVFIVLIMFSTGVNYLVGLGLAVEPRQSKRKLLLATSIVANLGILGIFKYGGFFSANTLVLLRLLGFDVHWTTLQIVLPVGISFYTFQAMSYTIDLYRGRIPVTRSPLDFALFVAFFPQLVAGPIVRAADFIPQLRKPIRLYCDQQTLFLVLRGLAKKVLIADNVAVLADAIFEDPTIWPSAVIWFATVCFAVQIYCDFSGYSDIAIGVGRILGFRIPLNFNYPYFARNPSDFWRRWHISLSSWLRDYLYIPLGGSRSGGARTYRNLMITMLLGGLWHGASWNFVVWGLLHGLLLIAHRLYAAVRRRVNPEWTASDGLVSRVVSIAAMQYCVLLTWIAFRVRSFDSMLVSMRKFVAFDFEFGLADLGLGALPFFSTAAILGAFFALHALSHGVGRIDNWAGRVALPWAAGICFALGFAAFALWPLEEAPFIYFQF